MREMTTSRTRVHFFIVAEKKIQRDIQVPRAVKCNLLFVGLGCLNSTFVLFTCGGGGGGGPWGPGGPGGGGPGGPGGRIGCGGTPPGPSCDCVSLHSPAIGGCGGA